jgi:anaerobic magnesium-protoporphyrin IX monomethyl ester cyclase
LKILVTHSYFLRFDHKQWVQRKPYTPLATLIAIACLKREGHEVEFIDANFLHSPEPVMERLKTATPDLFLIYDDGFNYLTKMCLTNMRAAAFKMLEQAQNLGIKALVSSSDSTDHFEEYLQHGASAVMLGEAEQTLLEITSGMEFASVSGLVYNDAGKIINKGKRKVNNKLDELPYPAWEELNIAPYQEAWKKHGYFSINIATTRGCPFKCNWCAKPIYGNRYNSHSPAYIVGLIKDIKSHFHFDHLWFCDDIFGLKPGWVQTFSHEMQEADLKIKYKIQSRADLLVKDDTVRALAQSGCDEVWIGAESGSQKILDAMDKGTSVAQIEESTELMKTHGIKPCFFLQFGYLGEKYADVMKTIQLLQKLKPHDIGVSVSYPLPGTKFYEKVKHELNQKANWADSDELLLMYKGEYPPEFYKRLHRYVHRKFRASKAWESITKREGSFKLKLSFALHKPLEAWTYLQMKKSLKAS